MKLTHDEKKVPVQPPTVAQGQKTTGPVSDVRNQCETAPPSSADVRRKAPPPAAVKHSPASRANVHETHTTSSGDQPASPQAVTSPPSSAAKSPTTRPNYENMQLTQSKTTTSPRPSTLDFPDDQPLSPPWGRTPTDRTSPLSPRASSDNSASLFFGLRSEPVTPPAPSTGKKPVQLPSAVRSPPVVKEITSPTPLSMTKAAPWKNREGDAALRRKVSEPSLSLPLSPSISSSLLRSPSGGFDHTTAALIDCPPQPPAPRPSQPPAPLVVQGSYVVSDDRSCNTTMNTPCSRRRNPYRAQTLDSVSKTSQHPFVMAAGRSRCGHYILQLWFLSLFFFRIFYFLAYLSGRRLDVYHTSTHDVALVRI